MQTAIDLACAAARAAGLDPRGAEVIRVGNSVLVHLPASSAVARVEPPPRIEIARQQAAVARALAATHAPTVRSLTDEAFVGATGAVTLWAHLDEVAAPTYFVLGQTVRALHDATREPPAGLPAMDPPQTVRTWLADPRTAVSDAQRRQLRSQTEVLAAEWPGLVNTDPLGVVLAHGDVHIENIMVGAAGPLLIDLECAGIGPASFDFAVLMVHVERYGLPVEDFESYVGGYGADPRGWAGFRRLVDLYEIWVALWPARLANISQTLAAEAELRLGSLAGTHSGEWTLS